MKIHPINAAAAVYTMIISSFSSTLLSRSGGAIVANAFRHAPSTIAPVVVRTHHLCGGNNNHRTRGRDVRSRAPSSPPSARVSRFGRSSARLYHGSGAAKDGGGDSTIGGGDIGVVAAVDDDADDDADDGVANAMEDGGARSDETSKNHRSRWSRRKQRKKMESMQQQGQNGDADDGETESGGLDWESFDYSSSPKMDARFEKNDGTIIPDKNIPIDSTAYKAYIESESGLDDTTSARSLRSRSDLASLSPALVRRSVEVLEPFVTPRRLARIDQVLGQRTRHARFLFENPSNPSNVWACLRTLDSFGVQYVDVVVDSASYAGRAAVGQKRGTRTAMGSAAWMTVRQHGTAAEAVARLREEEGCLIYASDLNPTARDARDLDWDVDFDDGRGGQRPVCVVMGNEENGISDEMRALADGTFYLPMCGFAESFNLSVATAVTLAYMSAASGGGDAAAGDGARGPLRPGDLDPHELQCLRLKGMLNSLAQKRLGKALLKKEGIVLPDSLHD